MKIIAVVVTYNRLDLLKKAIAALKRQTHKIDEILVINNGSTDGTEEWLATVDGITVITQENIGGSGGFWRGIKEAYKCGADYIWCMDDDVHPFDDCLENLLKIMPENGGIVTPQRLYNGNKLVLGGECHHFNFSNPFKPLKQNLKLVEIEQCDRSIDVESISFEGPIFSRNIIESIGLPKRDLFIFWDDTEYSYRAHRNGFPVKYAKYAKLFKEDLRSKNIQKDVKRSWKYPYMIRNEVYFVCCYGSWLFKNCYIIKLSSQYILGIIRHLALKDGKYELKDLNLLFRSIIDGISGRLIKY